MNKMFRVTTLALTTAAVSTGALAQNQSYNEPTRGFMLERGTTAPNKKASVDLRTGGDQDFSAGVRLGLPGSELVLNHSRINPRTSQNEALFKVGLRPLQAGDDVVIDWAAYGAVAHYDSDDAQQQQGYTEESTTNLGAGAAFTADIDRFILNFNPELVFDDGARNDASDAYLNLGMGAHYALPETDFGRFEPGLEVNVTTREDRFGDSVDPSLMLGTRWLYNENVTLDVSMIQATPNNGLADASTEVSIPGYIRLNVAF
ncbi:MULTISPECIES: hypothetical protein [Gammaproteobacteria]|uniref:Transporter n=1 Tax=Vreelandella halophila TaxID=86177 RepID=A0A9X5B2X7_9GAMM|nr:MULTISPECIES: hypothetical protein [Gammaproteobacteria]KAA8978278.1 hypothetical protein F3089_13755 [Halospina sp. K52047b]MYL25316.1 hypothetical protein [Halomonas utahensis]MYL75211.1 hypothetical protein [Halomonas sp. 22501_18_FS]